MLNANRKSDSKKNGNSEGVDKNKEEGGDRHRKNQTIVLYAIWKMVVCRELFFFFFISAMFQSRLVSAPDQTSPI